MGNKFNITFRNDHLATGYHDGGLTIYEFDIKKKTIFYESYSDFHYVKKLYEYRPNEDIEKAEQRLLKIAIFNEVWMDKEAFENNPKAQEHFKPNIDPWNWHPIDEMVINEIKRSKK